RMDPLAKRLKRLRAVRGLRQEALAQKAHVSRGYLARIELGRHDPTLSVLRRVAKGLRGSVAEHGEGGRQRDGHVIAVCRAGAPETLRQQRSTLEYVWGCYNRRPLSVDEQVHRLVNLLQKRALPSG